MGQGAAAPPPPWRFGKFKEIAQSLVKNSVISEIAKTIVISENFRLRRAACNSTDFVVPYCWKSAQKLQETV